eukprot:GHVQ01003870.1.p1 GENE.GHVQ01003870.1~~GHVQ01003870.1.p1  ORF type:complete len:179 (+),score=22.65 GHVQ01003870.1:164-700(+)
MDTEPVSSDQAPPEEGATCITLGNLSSLCCTCFPTVVKTVKDVRADAFISTYATHLKRSGVMEYPKWADYVKTGVAKELAPYDQDWIYVRAASILRHLYMRPDCGVGGFRKLYSSKKRRGSAPGHSKLASGKIVRYILMQFEKMGLVAKGQRKGGRRLTSEGMREVDTVARQCIVVAV